MTHEQFTNWLKGFMAACNNKPSEKQLKQISEELNNVQGYVSNGYWYVPPTIYPTITYNAPIN